MATTPAVKSAFEINPARQRPNTPDRISIARGNEVNTPSAHAKSFSPDVRMLFPEPKIEYASEAPTLICRGSIPPNALLEAVAAAPQPSVPPCHRVHLGAA